MHLQPFAVGAEWNTLGRGVDPRHPVPTVRETDVGRPSVNALTLARTILW
jgi:hypothetical protein